MNETELVAKLKEKQVGQNQRYVRFHGKRIPYKKYLKKVNEKDSVAGPVIINLIIIAASIFLGLWLTGAISLNFLNG